MHHLHGRYLSLTIAFAVTWLSAAPVLAQVRRFHFDIRSQPLSQALQSYGQVSDQQIVFTEDLVAGLASPPLKGEFTAEAALECLLQGSGLAMERSSSGVLMIRRRNASDPYLTKPAPKANPAAAPNPHSRHPDSGNPT